MKCPVCLTTDLMLTKLDTGLGAMHCESCAGNWISSASYWYWLEQRGNVPECESAAVIQVADQQQAKQCPECNRIMLRYKVGHDLDFDLDQCPYCNGVWFDKNEWESLQARNLHDDIHLIFTAPWQSEVAKEDRRKTFERIYQNKFGDADFAELKRVREWLDKHPKRNEMLAFLMVENPYGV